MMGDVFSSAERVIIWLGPEQKNDQYLVDMIKRRYIPVEADEAVALIRVLKRICWRPWFGRLWVAQELVLAKQTPVLRLGPRTVLWDDFHEYVTVVRDETEVRYDANELPYWSCNAMQRAFWRVDDLHRMRGHNDINIAHQLSTASDCKRPILETMYTACLGYVPSHRPNNRLSSITQRACGEFFLKPPVVCCWGMFCHIYGFRYIPLRTKIRGPYPHR